MSSLRVALDDFIPAESDGEPLLTLELNAEELDDFMLLFEQTANSAQDLIAMERLGHAFARVDRGLDGSADPGAHLVRPAASVVGYSTAQGQYLAFIFIYHRLHRRAPAESDFQAYFGVSAPAVHEMLKTLKRRGFIARAPGVPRSIRLLLRPHEIPELE